MHRRFSFATFIVGLLCAFMLVAALPTSAALSDFRVENDGAHVVVHLYVAPEGANSWGSDLLGQYELYPSQYTAALAGYTIPTCNQDMRAIYTDGHVEELDGVNVCSQYIMLHY